MVDYANMSVSGIMFETGEAAEAVLDAMKQMLKEYDVVAVADYRQLANLPVTYDNYKFGWKDLDEAKIVYTRGKFYLELPLVVNIQKEQEHGDS